jgi:hypothetical protein
MAMLAVLSLMVATGPLNVLVLAPRAEDFHGDVPEVLLESMAAELKQDRRLRVVTSSDVKDLISLAAQQELEGCDSSSCLTEVADAFGAGLVVFGDVNRVDREMQLALRLVNVSTGDVLARESAQAASTDALARATPATVKRLLSRAFPAAPPWERPLVITGGSVGSVGAVAGVGLGVWAGVLAQTLYGSSSSSADEKGFAFDALVPVAAGAALGVVVAAAGGAMVVVGMSE